MKKEKNAARSHPVLFAAAFLLLIFFLPGTKVGSGQDGAEWTGSAVLTVDPNDGVYFYLGNDLGLIVRPGTELHAWLRRHEGKKLRLSMREDPPRTNPWK